MEKQKQVAAQCRVIVHLANAIAELHGDLASIHEGGYANDILDYQGERTARLMETLGDILNGLDAVTATDEAATTHVFEKAREMFPIKSPEVG